MIRGTFDAADKIIDTFKEEQKTVYILQHQSVVGNEIAF